MLSQAPGPGGAVRGEAARSRPAALGRFLVHC